MSTETLPEGLNTWFVSAAPADTAADIILENNGTLRIYTKNKILNQNLIIQANVADAGVEFTVVEGTGSPSADQVAASGQHAWFKSNSNLYEIITTDDTKGVLGYTKVLETVSDE